LSFYLAVDIGNSNIKLAIFKKNEIKDVFLFKTKKFKDGNPDIIDTKLIKMLKNVDEALLISVVPEVTEKIVNKIKKVKNIKIHGIDDFNYNIKIDYDSTAGEDRLMGIYGAYKLFGKKSLVIDIGSALTFSVLDKNGTFSGGIIGLGPYNILNALTQNTSQLSKSQIHQPEESIGKNTNDAIDSGIYWMTIGSIEKSVEKIESQLDYQLTKIITGGGSKIFDEYFKKKRYNIDRYLVLKGINYFLRDNLE